MPWLGGRGKPFAVLPRPELDRRFSVVITVSTPRSSNSRPVGEELPRSSLDSGGSLEKAGIMAGIIGRSKRVGGGQSASTRWACRQPLKPSGLPHRDASRESRLITTWRFIHTQIACLNFTTFPDPGCVPMARLGVTLSAKCNREAVK